jgi:hypothetical protein
VPAKLGGDRIFLDTGEWLKPAQKLYQSLGFKFVDPYKETENDPGFWQYLVFMELKL